MYKYLVVPVPGELGPDRRGNNTEYLTTVRRNMSGQVHLSLRMSEV